MGVHGELVCSPQVGSQINNISVRHFFLHHVCENKMTSFISFNHFNCSCCKFCLCLFTWAELLSHPSCYRSILVQLKKKSFYSKGKLGMSSDRWSTSGNCLMKTTIRPGSEVHLCSLFSISSAFTSSSTFLQHSNGLKAHFHCTRLFLCCKNGCKPSQLKQVFVVPRKKGGTLSLLTT